MQGEQREIGLKSINESRYARRRALIAGKVRLRGEAAPHFWLWTLVIFSAFGVIYWQVSEAKLVREKNAVMARQRAIAQELGPRASPLRARIEAWVLELAGEWPGDKIEPGVDLNQIGNGKGLYLRVLADDATSNDSIKQAAELSVHDGFTSCLFVRNREPKPGVGTECFSATQCEAGELCNQSGRCAPPTQPFNLRLLYRGLRVLSPAWTDELHEVNSDFEVRMFAHDLDSAATVQVPVALALAQQSKYFTAVIDEPSQSKQEPPGITADADAGGEKAKPVRPQLSIHGVRHPIRVAIWELQTGKQLVRARVDVQAEFVSVGRIKNTDPAIAAARQRQMNNCAVALELREMVNRVRAH